MKFLQKLLAIDLPSVDDVEKHVHQQVDQTSVYSEDVSVPQIDDAIPVASICIHMMNTSDCKILIQWDEKSQGEVLADQFAQILYQLNEGEMKATIARIIISQGDSIGSSGFTNDIMQKWENLYEEGDDAPVVLPSEALPPGQ